MVSNVELMCSLCENIQSVKFTFSNYLKHLRLFHVHQANLESHVALVGVSDLTLTSGHFRIMCTTYITVRVMSLLI